jgi:integrase
MPRVVDSKRYVQQTLFDLGRNMTRIDEFADSLIRSSTRAPATLAAYDSDFRIFERWCADAPADVNPLPATEETLRRYVADRIDAGAKLSTVDRAIAAITFRHRAAGLEPPDRKRARALLNAAQRQKKEQPERKAALTAVNLAKICKLLLRSSGPIAVRDRSILTLAVTSALRRSNLSGIKIEDISFIKGKGMSVFIPSSKTDQMGEGKWLDIWSGTTDRAVCPVDALRAWIKVRGDQPGALFNEISKSGKISAGPLSGTSINKVVKKAVQSIGIDPARYGAHSTRAAYVTIAHNNGASTLEIMEQTGHSSLQMVKRYLRNEGRFTRRNPLARAI